MDEIVGRRVGREWSLFLDRDGVINRRVVSDYVRTWESFEWLPGARGALEYLSSWASHLVIVTNQQGVGKGLMTIGDVEAIHRRMNASLGRGEPPIDAFMVCPHLESVRCRCRKPSPGLVFEWLSAHRTAEPALSVMVGDSFSDMELAHHVADAVGGCTYVHIGHGDGHGFAADASFDSLQHFASAVREARRFLQS